MNIENEITTNKIASWPFDGLIEKVYLPYIQKHGESAMATMVNGLLPKMSFLSAYKRLPPIEQMEENAKKEMKQYVIETFPDKTPEGKIEACKIIYTIGSLL